MPENEKKDEGGTVVTTAREMYAQVCREYEQVKALPCGPRKWLRLDVVFALFGSTCFDLACEERSKGPLESNADKVRDELCDLAGDDGEVVVVVLRVGGKTVVKVALDKEFAVKRERKASDLEALVRMVVDDFCKAG